ncbi:hypothetical protein H7U37_03300 [Pseudoflavonifractor phocaeensis]|uniref:hypothetical protein n=1 Tax=Pseudoflavonifractor phocaeensis TaxID=1870988 RepID=UPI0019586562|nr:hypothetical protein [Pseudoflavonifractor phocaeensis]MBM6869318.1 hypothetical protein [Pseudoflavonifractor phocaeensis]MBM6937556.1 hypothetical protein [Pseudoflavonifractor phocaeensis]
MAKDAHDPLKHLRGNPDAAALLSHPQALRDLLRAPETQRLMRLLESKAGPALQQAAGEAAKGNPDALKGVVEQLMGSQEGAQAVEALQRRIPKS